MWRLGANVALGGAQVTNALDQLREVLRVREDHLRVHFYHVSIVDTMYKQCAHTRTQTYLSTHTICTCMNNDIDTFTHFVSVHMYSQGGSHAVKKEQKHV